MRWVLGLWAAAYVYLCGSTRFFFTHNVAYSGGYEVLSGRLPYRDFTMVTGPILFLIQGLFFKLFGLSYVVGYLSHPALFNAAATWLVYDFFARREKEASLMPAAAALLTSIWYYPMSRMMPWYDHDGFFFIFAAVWLISRADKKVFWPCAAAGLCLAVSFFTKQTNGLIALAALSGYAFAAAGPGAFAALCAGAGAGLLGLGTLFASWGGAAVFFDNLILRPLHGRPPQAGMALNPLLVFLLVPFSLAPLLPLSDAALILALGLIQLGGKMASSHEVKVFFPFLGVMFGLLAPALMRTSELSKGVVWATFLFLAALGLWLSGLHGVTVDFPGATFIVGAYLAALAYVLRRNAPIAALAALMALAAWGRCFTAYRRNLSDAARQTQQARNAAVAQTRDMPQLRGVRMPRRVAESLDALMEYFGSGKAERPVFFYPNCEFLYAAIGQPSPQPELWFEAPFTLKPGDGTEQRVMAALEKSGVKTVVVCADYTDPPDLEERFLAWLPSLRDRIRREGRLELELPIFRVYRLSGRRP